MKTRKKEQTRWGTCVTVVGLLAIAGAVTVSGLPSAAAQQAPVTGERQFNRACGRCHPHGGEDDGPSILNKNVSEERMTKQIREGSKRMKAIPPTKLSDADLTQVMVYLRSIHAVR